ncbi:MAG: hypothetical protein SFU99_09805 [Saprospiraceae bacterium]|nr:hypothetical protein [Saprospiraceae bacterium]
MQIFHIRSLIIAVIFGVLSNALWLAEIKLIVGWEGLGWLSYIHYSVFIIALFSVLSYVMPFYFIRDISRRQFWQATLEMYPATLVAFFLAKTILFSIYTQFYGYLNSNSLLALLLVVVLLIAFSIHFITKKTLHRVRWGHGLFIALGMVTVVPLSILSVELFPGFGNGSGFVDAVKMGYSFFWITVMMGLLGMRTAMWKPESEATITQDDILDDLSEED